MRYYVTARTAADKQTLLQQLDCVLDPEPGSLCNILISCDDVTAIRGDPRVAAVEPYPDDWPGYEIRLFHQ